ncbi:MAG: hypothetical protein FIB02_07510 [Desulfuromonas sp.]|nr:hypothetical protein [Desulfuromonas sp.]
MRRRTILILLMTLGTADAAGSGVSSLAPAAGESRFDQSSPLYRSAIAPPDLSEDIFPCSNCHAEIKPDLRRRELRDEHGAIALRHAAGQLWCLDCHHAENRDTLRLATGESLPFTESYRLCGQCHGEKLRDWQSGIHGRRTGHWNGDKQYLLCTGCHNPHDPQFKPLTPMPPPERPGRAVH